MDSGTALWILVALATLLTSGILLFLIRTMKVLAKAEETLRKFEEESLPILKSIRRLTEEVEPVVRKTTAQYRTLEEGLDSLARSPLLSMIFPILGRGGGILRLLRGLSAGISRAREVLKKHPAGQAPSGSSGDNTEENSHGR